jgi:outer membrane protein assembly factor BamB
MPNGNRTLSLFVSLGLLLSLASVAGAENWSRFRGPNGTGVAQDKNIPVQWDEKGGILWKVPIVGLGNSSPIVWGKSLFLQTAASDGKERQLLCLDVTTGQTIWARSVPGAMAKHNKLNSLASSTPATDGQRVYNAFWDGEEISLVAFDFKGNVVWHRKLGSFTSQHGAGASPVVYKDKVFFANDQDAKSTLLALDAKTGETVWQAGREPYRACYSAPFILERPKAAPELIVTSTTSIRSYDPDNGVPNWNWTWPFVGKMPLRTVASSLYHNDMLFASSGDGGGDRHMVAVNLTISSMKGSPPLPWATLAWDNRKDFPYVPTMLTHGDHLYFVNDRGLAGCFVAKTGQKVWFERLPDATFMASPVLIDGKMYAVSDQGEVFVFAASPTYQLLAKNSLGETVRATPAVADNRLFLRGQNHLFCIGKKNN